MAVYNVIHKIMGILDGVKFNEPEVKPLEDDERHMVFTGRMDGKSYQYIILDKDYINDGRVADGKKVWFSVRWSGNAGSIYKVKITELGSGQTNISYAKKNLPVGYWKNELQRTEWQAIQRMCEDVEAMSKKAKIDSLEKSLFPLREAYKLCRTRQERTIMMARIMDYIQN